LARSTPWLRFKRSPSFIGTGVGGVTAAYTVERRISGAAAALSAATAIYQRIHAEIAPLAKNEAGRKLIGISSSAVDAPAFILGSPRLLDQNLTKPTSFALDAGSLLGVNGPVSFVVAGDAYDRFMGRYSRELAPPLIEFARIRSGMNVLDVGSGPGALSERLAERVGPELVSAADPSEPFVAACAERVPGADVRQAAAEKLPWPDEAFDAALAQLVVNFMRDPHAGVAEMRRVVRSGGIVGACTWDYGDGMQMLRLFWNTARALDPDAPDEGRTMRFRSSEELEELWRAVGFSHVETGPLVVETTYADFDDFWQPLTLGVGPVGSYCKSVEPKQRKALRDELFVSLGSPVGPFTLSARAWAVRGVR
jgi:SAM-dependent methyltransferase